MMEHRRTTGAIFIQGVLPRCGTNFAFNLLRLHPDCGVAEPLWEDWLLEESHRLIEYARSTYGLWARNPGWGVWADLEHEVCQSIGQSLLSFLESRIEAPRLLTKTPSVFNLPHFFKLFPQAYLLIVMRDGRAVVESSARSFGWDRDETARKWARGADIIRAFDQAHRGQGARYRIVRYEDLFLNLEHEVRDILRFLGLDIERYDFQAAWDLPVYGSSTLRDDQARVHWEAVERKPEFNPLARWAGWTRRQHERFNWTAGERLASFGYAPQRYEGRRLLWRAYNRLADWAATLRIESQHHIAAAFEGYQQGDLGRVRRHTPVGMMLNPAWQANRGVWSILFQSLVGRRQ